MLIVACSLVFGVSCLLFVVVCYRVLYVLDVCCLLFVVCVLCVCCVDVFRCCLLVVV